jgi:hypothetical protein
MLPPLYYLESVIYYSEVIMDKVAAKILCERLHLERDLVLDFFCVFSRFEYALKRAGFAKKKRDSVSANWVKFGRYVTSRFEAEVSPELREAVNYVKDNAPMTQTIDSRGLGWRETQQSRNESDLEWVLRLVRTVRNNLFHGGRSPEWIGSDPNREIKLLRSSLVILDACLDCHPDLKRYFEDGLRGYEAQVTDTPVKLT